MILGKKNIWSWIKNTVSFSLYWYLLHVHDYDKLFLFLGCKLPIRRDMTMLMYQSTSNWKNILRHGQSWSNWKNILRYRKKKIIKILVLVKIVAFLRPYRKN